MPFGSGFGFMVSSASTASSAAAFLARWSSDGQGMVMDFADDQSVKIVDTSTPANNKDSSGIVSSAGALVGPGASLTYTSPSTKLCRQSSGLFLRQAHNLAPYSEDFGTGGSSTATGAGSAATLTSNYATGPYGEMTATRLQVSLNGGTSTSDISSGRITLAETAGASYVCDVWIKSTDGSSSYSMQLTDASGAGVAITVTGTWQKFTTGAVVAVGGASQPHYIRLRGGQTPTNANSADVLVSHWHIYRYPANTDYVKTTTAAVYTLPYEWNTSGECQGVLIEPAATNLLINNRTLASWAFSVSSAATTVTGISGVSNSATALTFSGAGYASYNFFGGAVASSTQWSGSAFMKKHASSSATVLTLGGPIGGFGSLDKVDGVAVTPAFGATNYIVNGTFTGGSSTGWTNLGSPTVSYAGNNLNLVSSSTNDYVSGATSGVTVGQLYRVTFDLTVNTVGQGIRIAMTGDGTRYTTSGSKTFYFIATANNQSLIVRPVGAVATDITIDNIVINQCTTEPTKFTLTDDWTRHSITISSGGDGNNQLTGLTIVGTEVAIADVDHTQWEATAYSTSPIETFASSLPRNADTIGMVGGFTPTALPLTAYAEIYMISNPFNFPCPFEVYSVPQSSNRVQIYHGNSANNYSNTFRVTSPAGSIGDGISSVVFERQTIVKMMAAVASGDSRAAVNNTLSSAVITTTLNPTFDRFSFSQDGGAQMVGYLRKFALFKTRLPDATIQSMTT